MMKTLIRFFASFIVAVSLAGVAQAQGNIEVNTPAVSQLKNSMQGRHAQLAPFYASGAVGLARDGTVQMHDANVVPLPQRGAANALITQENADRDALYREIARANGHPEWSDEIRRTFAQRWIDRAQPGWWVQNASGGWVKK
jgi:uncharacterized protein YdbL (DUF1318 family)